MTLYGLNAYWLSLLCWVQSLEERGVTFAMNDDGEVSVRIGKGRLPDTDERDRLKQHKQELLEAVRLREGLCVTCGMDAAKHPARKGEWPNWIQQTETVETGKCSALGVYPLYCSSCWDSRLMWQDVTRRISKHGSSKQTEGNATPDTATSGIRAGRETYANASGNSGGRSMETLPLESK